MAKILTVPASIPNQQYINHTNASWLRSNGCALCCGVAIANYRSGGNTYTADYFYNNYRTADGTGYSWNAPTGYLTELTYSQNLFVLARAITEINSNQLVAIHMKNSNGAEHWVVAYGYNNTGESLSDLLVLDPVNNNVSSAIGTRSTLKECMDKYNYPIVDKLRAY